MKVILLGLGISFLFGLFFTNDHLVIHREVASYEDCREVIGDFLRLKNPEIDFSHHQKIQALFSKTNFSKMDRVEDWNEFSAELYRLYFGDKLKTEGAERESRMLREQLMAFGLKDYFDHFTKTPPETLAKKIRMLLNSPTWSYLNFTKLPFYLPKLSDAKISDDLLASILVDGVNAHRNELEIYFKKQRYIDSYQKFRKYYNPLSFAIALYFTIQNYDKVHDKIELELRKYGEKKKQNLLNSLTAAADAMEKGANEVPSDEDFEKGLVEDAIKNFEEIVQRSATLEEKKLIESKITNKKAHQ